MCVFCSVRERIEAMEHTLCWRPQIGAGTGIYPLSTSVVHCQYHSTIAPYSSIHLPPTLYNVFLPVLQFPLSVSFHHCSILSFILNITLYQKDKRAKPGNLSKSSAFSQIGERCAVGAPRAEWHCMPVLQPLTVATAEINCSVVLHDHKTPFPSPLLPNASFPISSPRPEGRSGAR